MENTKKAQVTIFILIGIFVLIGVGVVVVLINAPEEAELEKDIERTEDISLRVKPVKTFVEQCISQITEEAVVDLVTKQGGYINTSDFTPYSIIVSDEHDAINLYGETVIPYWFYQENDIDNLRIPTLQREYYGDGSIADQIGTYVEQNLDSCTNQFARFSQQAIFITEKDIPLADVSINEKDISVKLDYPLEVEIEDVTEDVSLFSTSMKSSLYGMYELATSIVSEEEFDNFIDAKTVALTRTYSKPGISSSNLPPFHKGGVLADCGDVTMWQIPDIKDNFENTVLRDLSYMIRVNNTATEFLQSNAPAGDQKMLSQRQFDSLIKTVSQEDYPNLYVSFQPMRTTEFKINGDENGIVSGLLVEEINLMGIFSQCMYEYVSIYEIKYPVLITITDINDPEQTFQFAIQIVVDKNHPRKYDPPVSPSDEDLVYAGPEYLPSVDCMPEQRVSGDVNIKTINARTGVPAPNVKISYQCGIAGQTCRVGYTDKQGIFEGKFPPCGLGGMITLESMDYLGEYKLFDTPGLDEEMNISYELIPLRELDVKLEKYLLNAITEREFQENPLPFSNYISEEDLPKFPVCIVEDDTSASTEYDQATITLNKYDYQTGVFDSFPVVVSDAYNATVKLGPGRYHAEIKMLNTRQEIIPAGSERVLDEDGDPVLDEDDNEIRYPEEDVLLNASYTGGAILEFEVDEQTLYSSESITFYVLDEGAPSRIPEITERMENYEKCSANVSDKLKPKFS